MFRELEAWVNSDADPPARCDFGAVLADNGLKFSSTQAGTIWLESDNDDSREVSLSEAKGLILEKSELYEVFSASEAETLWGLAPGTVRAALLRDVIRGRKSGGTWLVTRATMEAHYYKQPPKKLV